MHIILIQGNTRKSDNLIETDYYCAFESSYFRFIHWNPKDLTEAEDIKKRWQEYIELYKKVLMTWKTTMVWSLT